MPDSLSIANAARAEISAGSIASFDEASLEARTCAALYPDCLRELSAAHDWSFANRLVALAEVANDRPAEWAYAYAVPVDLGRAIRVLPSGDAVRLHDRVSARFEIEAGVLYSWVTDALLDYAADTIGEERMPASFARALATLLASRIVSPIRKDQALKANAIKQAEVDRQRAIADDINRQPQQDPPWRPETITAREHCSLEGDGLGEGGR